MLRAHLDHAEHVHQDRGGILAPPVDGKIYEGRVARLHPDGDALKYPWGDEKRDRAGLEQILAELQTQRPFTLLHPDDLIARGAKADVVGTVIGARIDGDHVVAKILVTDARAIAAIDSGMHELSLGYLSELNPGGFQDKIRVDHLALVPMARCGATCALRADAAAPRGDCTCNIGASSYAPGIVEDKPNTDMDLTAHARHELPSSMFAAPDSKSLPLEDETHVQDAMARFNQTQFKGPGDRKAAYHHIIARAHQLGIDPSGFSKKYAGRLDEGNDMEEIQKKLDAALAEVAAQKTRADRAEGELTATKAALTAAEVTATNAQATLASDKVKADAALAAEKTRADAAEQATKDAAIKAKADAATDMAVAVKARVTLESQANLVLGAADAEGKPVDRSALSDRDIKIAVIKHVDGLEIAAEKPELFVDGVFEGAVSRAATAATSIATVRAVVMPVHGDGLPAKQPLPTGPAAEAAERQAMANRKRAGKA